MNSFHDVVKGLLETDLTLTEQLSGGILDSAEFDDMTRNGAENVPRLSDGVRIAPFMVLRWQSRSAYQSQNPQLAAENETLECYCYADSNYSAIESTVQRIKTLLHNVTHSSMENRSFAVSRHIFTSAQTDAPELGNVPLIFIRFSFITL